MNAFVAPVTPMNGPMNGVGAANGPAGIRVADNNTDTMKLVPPSNSEVNAFNAARMPEVQATAPQQPNKIMADISSRLDSLNANYNAMSPFAGGSPAKTATASNTPKTGATQDTQNTQVASNTNESNFREMFNRFQDMQMFTVRANLVTNGASSSTHTFNNLLKGQ